MDARTMAETPNTDVAAAGSSKAHSGELTTMSAIQAANRPKLPPGVQRDKFGHVYPPAGFVVK
jgi:hypothetical protein